jgi:glutaredoxin-like protein NrdH
VARLEVTEPAPTVVVVVASAAAHAPDPARMTARAPADANNLRIAVHLAVCLCIVAGMVGYLLVQVNDATGVRLAGTRRGDMDQPKVFVYAISTCGHCRAAKKLLSDNGVQYDFVDVDLLPREEMRKVLAEVAKVNPQQSFPTIIIGDTVIVGDREPEILEALGL